MSKSRGNTVEPWEVLDTYGADAFRWYFFTSKQPWDGYRFSAETIGEGVRLFLKQLWSTYYFYALYANAAAEARARRAPASTASRAAAERPRPLGALAHRGDRRARRRAPGGLRRDLRRAGDRGARRRALQLVRAPLAAALLGRRAARPSRHCARACWRSPRCSRRSARSSPMRSTTTSTASCASVHLCDFPRAAGDRRAATWSWSRRWTLARETVRLGLGARGKAKIKVRQPLGEAVVVADGRERAAIERLADVVREELNVRRVRFVGGGRGARQLRGEGQLPHARPAVRQRHAAGGGGDRGARPRPRGASALRDGGEIGISVAGREHTPHGRGPDPDDAGARGLQRRARGRPRGRARPRRSTSDLLREGRAREIVHAVQNARKSAGLQVEDRIELALDGDRALLERGRGPPRLHRRRDARRASCASASGPAQRRGRPDHYQSRPSVEGLQLGISLSRADARLRRAEPAAASAERRLELLLELLLGVGADDRLDRLAAP